MTRAVIDLAALRRNASLLLSRIGSAGLIAVLKDDAYGHGLLPCAVALDDLVFAFAVATIEEGAALRTVTRRPILLLGHTPPCAFDCIRLGLTPTVHSPDSVRETAEDVRLARQRGLLPPDARLEVALSADTGMHRYGFASGETVALPPELCPVQVYSHLSSPTMPRRVQAQKQEFDRFLRLNVHNDCQFTHLCSGSAAFRYGALGYSAVRAGLFLTGYGEEGEPVLTLSAPVVQTRSLPAGARLGYDLNYRMERPGTVGIIPVGYGDGLLRALSGAPVTRRGRAGDRPAEIVGRICMDCCTVLPRDGATVQVGDEVLFYPSAARCARAAGTIPYELLVLLGKRVVREYR